MRLVFAVATILSIAAAQSIPHAFTPLRNKLKSIDEFLREADREDRQHTDEQIAIVAVELAKAKRHSQDYVDLRESTKQQQMYLESKAGAAKGLIDTIQSQKKVLEEQLHMLETECEAVTRAQTQISNSRHHRIGLLQTIIRLLPLQAPPTSFQSGDSMVLFQSAMAMAQSDSTATELTAPTATDKRQDALNQILPALTNLSTTLLDDVNEMRKDAADCAVARAGVQLRLIELQSAIDKVVDSSNTWLEEADYKHRQLIAAETVQVAKDEIVKQFQQEINDIANAYQLRRNSRIQQLCEVVTLRRAVTKDDIVVDAILPGPSQHASATIGAVDDTALKCVDPKHALPTIVPIIVRKCDRPELSLDGRKTLDDEWAKKVSEPDCDPPRVVDVNVTD
eukprot:c7881_g1_i1.p1 GENE.c7881_g1_i1~~c7881_g1_i1.p1  ORF type:complete len:395 (-),score=130.28 c7881_g1_i1:31-1215(-)